MKLREILSQIAPVEFREGAGRGGAGSPLLDLEISSVCDDSRRVTEGSLFVAIRGEREDGHRFIPEAVKSGAAAIVADRQGEIAGVPIPTAVVGNARRALGIIASALFGYPSRELGMVGITGTNGKSTTAFLTQSVLRAAGYRCGLIGTVHYDMGDGHPLPASQTTPGALDLQSQLAQMLRSGAGWVAMEVSSHALAQYRVEGCLFDVAVFTNLTRDHLDYHQTLDAYFSAKARLFSLVSDKGGRRWRAVVNLDDPKGEILSRSLKEPLTYGLNANSAIHPGTIELTGSGIRFSARTPSGDLRIDSPLLGRFNVYNLLAAVGVGVALDLPNKAIEEGLSAVRSVPGRLERIDSKTGIFVAVDYAHTDDALRRLLLAVRELMEGGSGEEGSGRLILLFGCGGDRDRGKRPLMGRVAAELADVAVVTSDNPRTEAPEAILDEILSGMRPGPPEGRREEGRRIVQRIVDRREAISYAISIARPGDAVLIAGKGHEAEQIVGEERCPFDDRQVAREALAEREAVL